ncbi:N-acetyltransferase family protein [Streptomyces sp. SYSU K21746]
MSEPQSHIRLARTADADALAALDRATWSPLHSVQPKPEPPYAPFFDDRHLPVDYLVADFDGLDGLEGLDGLDRLDGGDDRDGPVAGYIRLAPPTPLASNGHVLQVQGLAVADSALGRGLGRSLLRAACAEARRRGASRITLRVLGHNTPARRLYESEGFVVEGVLPGEFLLDGHYVDDILMGRGLTA